ncbi:MAG TPA: hypothetical protein PLK12_13000, partial [Prolixibacteraceae bacterium]|nr:hypothetical protein [Prolixibacteraceae bacterium]
TNNNGTAGLVIQSDATGTGKLVNNTTGVEATVQQFIAEDKWHYMGIPFAETPKVAPMLKGLWVVGSDEQTATHNSGDGWSYLTANDVLTSGKGFGVFHDLDTTITLYGTLKATEQVIPVSWKDGDHGWNLISNPFPCTADWDYIRTNSGLSNVNDAIYVYDPVSDSYASYVDGVTGGAETQDQNIAPMQGFFVRSTAEGTITFSENSKSVASGTFKSSSLDQLIRLTLISPNSQIDNTVVRMELQSTEKFDGHFDAYKLLSANSETSQLYSVLNGDDYSINSIPDITEETVIPLRALTRQDGEHILALSRSSSYRYPYPVLLYNPSNGDLVDLESDDYRFETVNGETIVFQLVFTKNGTRVQTIDLDNTIIEMVGHQLLVTGLGAGTSTIWIYNAKGQVVSKGITTANCYEQDNLPFGVLLIRV